MCVALEYTQKITDILQEAEDEEKKLYNLVHCCDLKTCDLLHEIELTNIKGMYHAWLILKELKKVRQIRRQAKDELETLNLIYKFQISQRKKYKNVTDMINQKREILNHRHYNTRVTDDFLEKVKI